MQNYYDHRHLPSSMLLFLLVLPPLFFPLPFPLISLFQKETRENAKVLAYLLAQSALPYATLWAVISDVLPSIAKESDSWRVKSMLSFVLQCEVLSIPFPPPPFPYYLEL